MNSAIYEGSIRHRRHLPSHHMFSYRMFQAYLDLDEIESVFDGRWLWSVNHRNVAEFRRSDFHGDPERPLAETVRDTVQRVTGARPDGPIRLLTHLRYFGHSFNPVSIYYGFLADGTTLDWVMAEITNTPWRQRHAYVLPVSTATRRGSALEWDFDKCFHVSPFMAMQRRYRWRLQVPGEDLRVHMEVGVEGGGEFDATLVMQRRPMSAAVMASSLARFPLLSLRILAAIHWQALRLWLKGVPVHDHPDTAAKAAARKALR